MATSLFACKAINVAAINGPLPLQGALEPTTTSAPCFHTVFHLIVIIRATIYAIYELSWGILLLLNFYIYTPVEGQSHSTEYKLVQRE